MAEKPSINPVCDLPEFRGPLGHEQPRNLDIAAHREEAGRGHPLFRELTAPTGSPAAPGSSIPKLDYAALAVIGRKLTKFSLVCHEQFCFPLPRHIRIFPSDR
jgi:hypothetical protein